MTVQEKQVSLKMKESTIQTSALGNRIRSFLRHLLLSEYFVLYLCIAYFVVLVPFVPGLASIQNLSNVSSNMWPLLAIAVGQTVVLIIAGIDLSQVSIIGFTSVIGAMFMTTNLNPTLFTKSPMWGWFLSETGGPLAGSWLSIPAGILAMLATGTLIGWLNGTFIARFNMPAFMVTLVTQMFFGAFAIFLTKSENIIGLPQSFISLGSGGIAFIPYSLIVTGVLAAVAQLFLSKSKLGRWLFATGTNIKASVVSGIPTKKVVTYAYMFSGFCAAAGSVLYSARLQMGRPTLGATILMDIIGATVIGGTSMFGGKGKIVWTLFGVLFFVLLANTLNLLNLSYFTINIVKGAVILLAAFFDVIRTRIMATEYRSEKAGN